MSAATVPVDEMDEDLQDDPQSSSRVLCECKDEVKMNTTLLSGRLHVGLGQSELLKPQLWQVFIQAIFDQKIIDVFYTSKRSYAQVAMGLIGQFGDPVTEFPSYLFDSVEALKKRLRTKLKNERYRSKNEDVEVERASKQLKRVSNEQARRGLPFYLPTTAPPSLDVITAMKSLNEDSSGDASASLKQVSFGERRRVIVSCRLPISRLVDKCPWLFSHDAVWEEFAKITGKADIRFVVELRWTSLLMRLKDVGDGRFTDDQVIEALLDLLGTDISRLVGPDAQQPAVANEGDHFALVVECVAIGKVQTLAAAVLLWAVAHIVYAQRVCRGERRAAYIFLHNLLLCVSDSCLVPKLCWSVAKRLKM